MEPKIKIAKLRSCTIRHDTAQYIKSHAEVKSKGVYVISVDTLLTNLQDELNPWVWYEVESLIEVLETNEVDFIEMIDKCNHVECNAKNHAPFHLN